LYFFHLIPQVSARKRREITIGVQGMTKEAATGSRSVGGA